ncbi:hypothetical protein GJ744_001416 [Endocarpon pusillum]|uniref:Uncharacterized protein n=1 Tax=Endocarpon pusillum TaxID=364733 RepID=A0A8H7AT09_9EURO|nr:hypothetical protein GJ744_001416 [Endocarpon pusillum]
MAHSNSINASQKYHGLPGEESYARRAFDKHFEELYSNDVNAESLYKAQTHTFARFAKVHPRVAFLLDQLLFIYDDLDTILDMFKLNYRIACPENSLSQQTVRFKGLDPFGYFSTEGIDYEHRSCLLHLRSALDQWNEGIFGPIFRETARDVLHHARTADRSTIMDELLSEDTALELDRVPVSKDRGIWVVRRDLASKENMLSHSLQRIKNSLDNHEISNEAWVQYGREPARPLARFATSPAREERHYSPERSQHRARKGNRSMSRESSASSRAPPSTIYTWAPEEPGLYKMSIAVWSATKEQWVDSMAVMDTGCEGGNFVSSAFLTDHLDMVTHIEDGSDEHHVQWVDFQGKTDFKPTGKVKLRWYGRVIESGRKGRRGQEMSSWFRVAPHLDLESGVQPFQVLLGQEFLHENQLIQYTGLRLYKSKPKQSAKEAQEDEAETRRRQQQRQDLERLHSRKVSISTVPTIIPSLMKDSSDDLSIRSRTDSSVQGSPNTGSTVDD